MGGVGDGFKLTGLISDIIKLQKEVWADYCKMVCKITRII